MAEKKFDPKTASQKDLLAEVERLQKALATSNDEKDEIARRAASWNGVDEQPTGKTVMVTKCKGYKVVGHHDDGRRIMQPQYHEVEEPTYFYTIDMPPVGGVDIKLNGQEYFHNETYEVTLDVLKTLKDIVWRLWQHENSIHQNNEKAYRQHYEGKFRRFFPSGALTPSGKKVVN